MVSLEYKLLYCIKWPNSIKVITGCLSRVYQSWEAQWKAGGTLCPKSALCLIFKVEELKTQELVVTGVQLSFFLLSLWIKKSNLVLALTHASEDLLKENVLGISWKGRKGVVFCQLCCKTILALIFLCCSLAFLSVHVLGLYVGWELVF